MNSLRVALLVLLLALGGAYFKGRADKEREITTAQLAANAKALQDAASAAAARAAADDASRQKAQAFMDYVDRGLTSVQKKFADVPTVVVDDRGCQRLSTAAGLRWNAVELLPAGSALDAAGKPAAAVSAVAVPAP